MLVDKLRPHHPAGTLGFMVAKDEVQYAQEQPEVSILRPSQVFQHAAVQLGHKDNLLQGTWTPWKAPAICSTVMEPVHSKDSQGDVSMSQYIWLVHVRLCTISLPLHSLVACCPLDNRGK